MKKKIWQFTQNQSDQFECHELQGIHDENDLLLLHPQSVYTTFRTYERINGIAKYLKLDDHLKRMQRSCELQNSQFELARDLILSALRQINLEDSTLGDLRIKLIYDASQPKDLFILTERLIIPDSYLYKYGAKAILSRYVRENPQAKSLQFINIQHLFGAQIDEVVNEVLMVDQQNNILEGLSSNFFAIMANKIYTADENILNGITRQMVLDLFRKNGFDILYQPVKVDMLNEVDECFITSTSRKILPIVQIGQTLIGDGTPGRITRQMMQEIDQAIKFELTLL